MAGGSSPPPDSDQYGNFSSHPSPLAKKTPPLPWTSQETVSLIQTYREKWYSLNRGPLKANQWEEVAVAVAARCGFDELSKSSTQCRHKIEKLRKRYRSERVKPYPNSWEFFELMDHMERGPPPIAARPVAMVMHQNSNHDDSSNRYEDENDDGYGDFGFEQNNLNCSDNNGTNDPSDGEGGDGDSKLAGEIRGFAEEFVRLEKKKMEMIKETEKCRMEMEKRKTDMILETQRKIANSISRIFEQQNKRLKMEV